MFRCSARCSASDTLSGPVEALSGWSGNKPGFDSGIVMSVRSIVSRRPTLKRGSGEIVYKKLELRDVYWMTFYVLRKCTVYVTTSIQPDPLTASPN